MTARYAWQCPQCGGDIELNATQAGQQFECAGCEASINLPKLGVIKGLPLVSGVAAAQKRQRSGSVSLKSWLFAGGLLLATLGGVAGLAAQYRASQYRVEVDLDEVLQGEYELIDETPPAQLYAITVSSMDESFALEYSEPTYRTRNIKSGIIEKVAWGCWGVAGAGLLMLLSSFALRS